MARTVALLGTIVVAAAGLFGAPEAARAQCRLCSTPSTEVQQTASSSEIQLQMQGSLDFDRLVLLGTGQGSAVLRPDGDRSSTGTIAAVSARAMVGSVSVHGEPGRQVRIDLPRRIELFSMGGSNSIAVDELETDLPESPRLDSAGNLTFRFGGRVTISGDADGNYRGDIPLTVEYL